VKDTAGPEEVRLRCASGLSACKPAPIRKDCRILRYRVRGGRTSPKRLAIHSRHDRVAQLLSHFLRIRIVSINRCRECWQERGDPACMMPIISELSQSRLAHTWSTTTCGNSLNAVRMSGMPSVGRFVPSTTSQLLHQFCSSNEPFS
jgi:hypothetical protein